MVGLHLKFVGRARGMKSYMYGNAPTNSWIHTTNPGGTVRCVIIGNWRATSRNLPPNRPATPALEWQTACEKGGQDTKHIDHKERNLRGGSGGTTRKTLPWATLLRGSNQCFSLTICRRQIAVYSHICACALKGARHWRAGLDSLPLSLFIAVRNTSQIQMCILTVSRWKSLRKSLRRPIAHMQAGGFVCRSKCNIWRSRIFWLNRYRVWRSWVVR